MTAHGMDDVKFDGDSLARFRSLFNRFSHDLDGALERADKEFSKHMPSKGDVCEAAVRRYLSDTLGSRYSVSHGIIFDSLGYVSKQQDVIIYDDDWPISLTPKASDEPALIPVESVYATVEVKKNLTATNLKSAIKNIRSFKSLNREKVTHQRITPNRGLTFISERSDPLDYFNPYVSAIFAFACDSSIEKIYHRLLKEVEEIPSQEWPDLILIHNQGLILPYCTFHNGTGATINSVSRKDCYPSYWYDELGQSYSLLGFHLLLANSLHPIILDIPNYHNLYSKLATASRALRAKSKIE